MASPQGIDGAGIDILVGESSGSARLRESLSARKETQNTLDLDQCEY